MQMRLVITFAAGLLALVAATAQAQAQAQSEQQPTQRDRIVSTILGTLLGDRTGASTTLDSQWSLGQLPLTNQRAQFDARVDSDIRAGELTRATGTRLKAEYAALIEQEQRYGADRRFTTQERTELADRYGVLTQVLADGRWPTTTPAPAALPAAVANGRADFERRVDSAVSARRISRTQGTQLKADYTTLVTLEAGYLQDGELSLRERNELDTRLDALDARVGDVGYAAAPATARMRLDSVARAIPSAGLSTAARTQLQVELEDVSRLEAAYGQLNPSADDKAYLERRLANLETRAKVKR